MQIKATGLWCRFCVRVSEECDVQLNLLIASHAEFLIVFVVFAENYNFMKIIFKNISGCVGVISWRLSAWMENKASNWLEVIKLNRKFSTMTLLRQFAATSWLELWLVPLILLFIIIKMKDCIQHFWEYLFIETRLMDEMYMVGSFSLFRLNFTLQMCCSSFIPSSSVNFFKGYFRVKIQQRPVHWI